MNINSKTKFIIDKLEKSSIWQQVDCELIPFINALNSFPGITSDVSCSGHKQSFPYVYFTVDGKNHSLLSLAAITDGLQFSNWFVLGQTISGNGRKELYYIAIPSEALIYKGSNPNSHLIKIPMGDLEVEFDFEMIANELTKRLGKEFGLRTPLFKIPQEL